MVYEETSGLYYDYNSGYYYDAEKSLYYDGNSGTYYQFSEGEYRVHSTIQPDELAAQKELRARMEERVERKRRRGRRRSSGRSRSADSDKESRGRKKRKEKEGRDKVEDLNGKQDDDKCKDKNSRRKTRTRTPDPPIQEALESINSHLDQEYYSSDEDYQEARIPCVRIVVKSSEDENVCINIDLKFKPFLYWRLFRSSPDPFTSSPAREAQSEVRDLTKFFCKTSAAPSTTAASRFPMANITCEILAQEMAPTSTVND